ncbi:hypothetical protein [Klebsiella pneumoniae]|uniref:hypothetical protein n=1 Tax=Klebsiella pneumoniae TaxID=573 RepID=UPI003F66DE1F
MTNITELAQRLKLEVHRAVSNFNPQMNIKTRDLKELVEALEKAQTKADIYDMLRDDYGLREKGVGLTYFVDWQAKRIAELESRAVKLPQRHSMLLREGFNEDYHTEMAFKADEVQASLAAAGIKVEAQ